MRDRLRAYPMVLLLLPVVAAILIFDLGKTPQFPEGDQVYWFVLKTDPKPTAKCERYEARALSYGDVFLYLLRDSTRAMPMRGDTIRAYTSIESSGRTNRAFAARYTVKPAKQHKEPLQKILYQRLSDAGLSGDELATIGALTLGYKDDIDPEVKRHFQASGAAHVLAVSGLHTGILYALLIWLLTGGGFSKPMYEDRFRKTTHCIIVIIAMWAYAWLTGMTPSVVRAVIMVTIVEIGKIIYRESISLNTIAAAAILILLVKPEDLFSVSFQLSFAATAAIVIIMNAFPLHLVGGKEIGRKTMAYVIGIIAVSLAAQAGTLPITMYYFGQISTYFLLTNLIVLPLATLLVPCGLATIALGGTWIGRLMGKMSYGLAWAMNHSTGWIEHLRGSTVSVHINGWMVGIYYIGFFIFCILLTNMYLKKD